MFKHQPNKSLVYEKVFKSFPGITNEMGDDIIYEFTKIYDKKIYIIRGETICRPYMLIRDNLLNQEDPPLTSEILLTGRINFSPRRKVFYYILNKEFIRYPLLLETQDQIVFKYLYENKDLNYKKFIYFLRESNFPLLEKYAYYLFGRLNQFDLETINEMKTHLEFIFYGSYYYGEVYHWQQYLEAEARHKNLIQSVLEDSPSERSNYSQHLYDIFAIDIFAPSEFDRLHLMFIKYGWDYAKENTQNDEENYSSYQNNQAYESMKRDLEDSYIERDTSCPYCQEDPCMCSDPDAE